MLSSFAAALDRSPVWSASGVMLGTRSIVFAPLLAAYGAAPVARRRWGGAQRG